MQTKNQENFEFFLFIEKLSFWLIDLDPLKFHMITIIWIKIDSVLPI